MSLTVLLIGAAHGAPIVLASAIFRRKWVAIAVALGMVYVATTTGGQSYLGADLLGIFAGTVFAWFIARPPVPINTLGANAGRREVEDKHRRLYERNQALDKAAKEYGSKLLVKWAHDGLWGKDVDGFGVERKRAICEKLVRCSFDPSRQNDLLDENFLHQIRAEAKDDEACKRMYSRAVLDCLDLGILPPAQAKKFREDFVQAFDEERKRHAEEQWKHLVDLANKELERQGRSR